MFGPNQATVITTFFIYLSRFATKNSRSAVFAQDGTKQWTTRKGLVRGGKLFNKDSLYKILANITYIGMIRYKSEVHNGEHAAIIDDESF